MDCYCVTWVWTTTAPSSQNFFLYIRHLVQDRMSQHSLLVQQSRSQGAPGLVQVIWSTKSREGIEIQQREYSIEDNSR